MAKRKKEICQGIWEQIVKQHSSELAGRTVSVQVMDTPSKTDRNDVEWEGEPISLPPENQRMLRLLEAWTLHPLTENEVESMERAERFILANRFALRSHGDE